MYAKVKFIGKDGLGKPYEYHIDPDLAAKLHMNDYVVVECSRTNYTVGVFDRTSENVEDPSIVTKAVVHKVYVQPYVPDPLPDLFRK